MYEYLDKKKTKSNDIKKGNFQKPIQRVIDYRASTTKVPRKDSQEELISFLQGKFPDMNSSYISISVSELDEDKRTYTLDDVYDELVRRRKPMIPMLGKTPSMQSSFDQFAFTTRTRLACDVHTRAEEHSEEDKVVTLNIQNIGDKRAKTHAERILLEDIKRMGDVRALMITLNNSPCKACAIALAEYAKTGVKIEIRFANPYGSREEFPESLKILQDAGIKVHSFDIVSLEERTPGIKFSSKYKKRAEGISKRRRDFRAIPGYHSDPESDPESDSESDSEMDESVTPLVLEDSPGILNPRHLTRHASKSLDFEAYDAIDIWVRKESWKFIADNLECCDESSGTYDTITWMNLARIGITYSFNSLEAMTEYFTGIFRGRIRLQSY